MQHSQINSQVRNSKIKAKGFSARGESSKKSSQSAVSMQDLEVLKDTVLWTDEDQKYIRMSREVLEDQTDDILELWFDFIETTPHLAVFFGDEQTHTISEEDHENAKELFRAWVLETAEGNFDEDWLEVQNERAVRHHESKRTNTHDGGPTTMIKYRYVPALAYPMTATLKPFLAKKHDHDAEDIECMYHAWMKAVTLQVCIWSQPYIKDGEY